MIKTIVKHIEIGIIDLHNKFWQEFSKKYLFLNKKKNKYFLNWPDLIGIIGKSGSGLNKIKWKMKWKTNFCYSYKVKLKLQKLVSQQQCKNCFWAFVYFSKHSVWFLHVLVVSWS